MGIKTLREISEKKRGEDMFEKLERKLVNVLLFFDLFKMKTKIPTDFRGVMPPPAPRPPPADLSNVFIS